MVDGIPTFLENKPEDYRGYYSRVVLDGGWDEAWESSNGVYDLFFAALQLFVDRVYSSRFRKTSPMLTVHFFSILSRTRVQVLAVVW